MIRSIRRSGAMASVYDFSVKDIHGKTVNLDRYKGKVMLIVNTASECGYTPQYKGLEALHKRLADKGLAVLGSEAIRWNFTKFFVDRKGNIVERYAPKTEPEAIVADIEKLL